MALFTSTWCDVPVVGCLYIKCLVLFIARNTSHFTSYMSHVTRHTSSPRHIHKRHHEFKVLSAMPIAAECVIRKLTPHTKHLTPQTSHLTPHTSHLTPHTSHLTPHTSHLTPHTHTSQICASFGVPLRQRFPCSFWTTPDACQCACLVCLDNTAHVEDLRCAFR